MLRAIGPSLVGNGIPNALPDPVLRLYDGNGSLVFANDNWRSAQESRSSIQVFRRPMITNPRSSRHSHRVTTPAMVHDANQDSGVALVEVYDLETQ